MTNARVRRFLQAHPPKGRRRKMNDFIVAYFVPTYVWQRWACWFWEDEKGTTLLKGQRALQQFKKDSTWLKKRPMSDRYDGDGHSSDSSGRGGW